MFDYSYLDLNELKVLWSSARIDSDDVRRALYVQTETASKVARDYCSVDFVPVRRTYSELLLNRNDFTRGALINIPPYNEITSVKIGDTDITSQAEFGTYLGLMHTLWMPVNIGTSVQRNLTIEGVQGFKPPSVSVDTGTTSLTDNVLTVQRNVESIRYGCTLGITFDNGMTYTYYAKESISDTEVMVTPVGDTVPSGVTVINGVAKYDIFSPVKQVITRLTTKGYNANRTAQPEELTIDDYVYRLLDPFRFVKGI